MLAPLPDGRWITFVGHLDDGEVERLERDTSIDAVAATIQRRAANAISAQNLVDNLWVGRRQARFP